MRGVVRCDPPEAREGCAKPQRAGGHPPGLSLHAGMEAAGARHANCPAQQWLQRYVGLPLSLSCEFGSVHGCPGLRPACGVWLRALRLSAQCLSREGWNEAFHQCEQSRLPPSLAQRSPPVRQNRNTYHLQLI
ncbi:hypothetical protein VFPBJ_01474 [Purpureocillium lilacinum]|uniref:Uncharacterized protein n=1 Tax=Purpureocillium lilacinum TaxID=33203 RepID=A0A179HBF4_PURLI|nr:hypothetical protein VFPBJ_01474 [Purpureocillium lilacinum]